MVEYFCKCCDKDWGNKTMYYTHLASKKFTKEPRKKRTWKKPLVRYICELCNEEFICMTNLKKHVLAKKRIDTHIEIAKKLNLI